MKKVDLLQIAIKCANQSEEYTRGRFQSIMESEDLYYNKIDKPMPGLFNAPIPVMGGFVDTLLSRISGKTVIKFNKQDNSDAIRAKKISAMWAKDSAPDRGNWHEKDIIAKKQSIFSGRAIYLIYSESDPEYKNYLEVINYKDFLCEPKGGYYLEKHLFTGRKNVFKTKEQIKQGIKDGLYEADALEIFAGDNVKKLSDDNALQTNTGTNLGLQQQDSYETPTGVASLHELVITTSEGRYYILFSKERQVVVSWGKWSKRRKSNRYPYMSWASHPDLLEFWSKSAADDIKAIAYSINTLINQGLNNIQKRNFPMRAYDSAMFTDPKALTYKVNGVVPVNSYGTNIGNGVYEFQTPDNTQIIMSLINFLDGLGGLKTGITADVQGASRENAVGIYYGNMEQIASRFGPLSTYYTNCWIELGKEYLSLLSEHLTEKQMVKMIGVDGIRWDAIKKEDLKTKEELEINISATNQEAQIKESEIKAKTQSIALLTNNPAYTAKLNPDWVIEETLKMAGYDDDSIMRALDVNNTASEDQLNRAAEVIEQVVEGIKPRMNFQADTGFIQKIIDFATSADIDEKVMNTLYAYAMQHMKIVAQNTARKALLNQTPATPENGLSTNNVPGLTTMNIPNPTPENVQERSQTLTQNNK